tara:strand:- start:328 stop:840 length:513 start_codon:yes stop_codon:yes gene_type:complete
MFKVVDNFLNKDEFKNIKETIQHPLFTWYYYPAINYEEGKEDLIEKDLNQYQFTHTFYENNRPNSPYFDNLQTLLNKLNCKSLVRIKANLNPYSSKLAESGYHIDFDYKNLKTAVYYINTNNGYTKFKKNNKKIKSLENRIVKFDSSLEHLGTNTTDSKRRIVLNINYFE